MSKVRKEPVSLNESTLETNIAAEISSLFNSYFNFYPFRLRYLFGVNLINFKKRKVKFYRLTPIEENKGGGWDTKIVIPKGKNETRALFIQFKRGIHSEGNSIPDSLFNIKNKNPNPNIEFKFNDNSNNNQHQTLKKLADKLQSEGISANTVMYGFPRITNLDKFADFNDDLLLITTFLTLPEIDYEATKAKINLYDNSLHHLRTCYKNENKREISSKPFKLESNTFQFNVLFEILLVKLSYLRNNLFNYNEILPNELIDEHIFLELADYLKINPLKIDERFKGENNKEELNEYFAKKTKIRNKNYKLIFGSDSINEKTFKGREELYIKIRDFIDSKNNFINLREDIPSNYTFTLDKEKKNISINGYDGYITLLTF